MSQDENALCCPKCGSTVLSTDKKGFGTGKFVAGTLLVNPLVGVLAGGIGKNKREVYCLKCGGKFIPGSTFNGLITVKEYNEKKALEKKMKETGEDKECVAWGCGFILFIVSLITLITAIANKNHAIAIPGVVLLLITVVLFSSARKAKKKRLQHEEQAKRQAEQDELIKEEQERLTQIEEKKKNITVSCNKCGTHVQGNMKFCPQCGNKIEITGFFFCPFCNTENANLKMKFCSNCGKEFSTFQATEKFASTETFISTETVLNNDCLINKPGCLNWIGAYMFPYFFVFSKHKSIRKFSLIWFTFIIMIATICCTIESTSRTNESNETTNATAPKIEVKKTITSPEKKKVSDIEIKCFNQLSSAVQVNLNQIGIKENLGTKLYRRADLEDSVEMRCYRITKSCILPDGCNTTVFLYMKNGSIYQVSYNGRIILSQNKNVHIKQAAVDFYYKYKPEKIEEIKTLIKEGWRPSPYAFKK